MLPDSLIEASRFDSAMPAVTTWTSAMPASARITKEATKVELSTRNGSELDHS